MNKNRIEKLREGVKKGKLVIYWMRSAHRIKDNHALLRAIKLSNELKVSLKVIVVFPEHILKQTERFLYFYLEGLKEVQLSFQKMKINFTVLMNPQIKSINEEFKDVSHLVTDKVYLKEDLKFEDKILEMLSKDISIEVIDTNVIVPVRKASDKMEYGAYTIRRKLTQQLEDYLDLEELPTYKGPHYENNNSLIIDNIEKIVNLKFPLRDRSVSKSKYFFGGELEAVNRLKFFLEKKISFYSERNHPGENVTSLLSPYIRFGYISTNRIVHELRNALNTNKIKKIDYDSFIEQLFVRRELAFNFVAYQKNYDVFEYITEPWCYQTMKEHALDKRDYIYSLSDLENCNTHDKYWNSSMKEMKKSGYMHNYMRMYWAKKIIEWTNNYKEAFKYTIYLNNKYFLDGNDPNSYTGVAWNYGRHDRPWIERKIFGKLRYMNSKGLERKFDMQTYIDFVNKL